MDQLHLFFIEAVKINAKTMILGGDADTAAGQILDGVISPMVAEFKFIGPASQS